ncbi:hypothetical protein BH09ACT12_BH09ACT12_36690 [soil metagenome]
MSARPEGLFAWPQGELTKAKVTQCALSRVCGGCGRSLGRPIAFVGTAEEVGRNEFHAPPMHTSCAEDARREIEPGWEIVLTGGFEFVRPAKDDLDARPRFQPNSLL